MAETSPNSNSESATVGRRLPQDLITEILMYLPVKPLMRFKCVSKQWLSMISSPQFGRSHFSKSLREDKHSNTQQLLFTTHSGMKQCSLYSVLHEPSAHVSDIEYPSQEPDVYLQIVGIVNGLVCLSMGERGERGLYVWNPVLRKSKLLPSSNSILKGCSFVAYGFGYDELNDDYKVVEVLCVCRGGVYETELKVYSFRADSWRRIEDLKGGILNYATGKYAIGKIFWISNQIYTLSQNKKIVCLDMVSEKYEEVRGPYYECGIGNWGMGVLNGRPSLLSDNYSTKADLWIMDKFGVEESWSKVISLPYGDVRPANALPYCANSVLCISRDGEIVFVNDSGLQVFRSKDKKFQRIQLGGFSSIHDVSLYVESMVPL